MVCPAPEFFPYHSPPRHVIPIMLAFSVHLEDCRSVHLGASMSAVPSDLSPSLPMAGSFHLPTTGKHTLLREPGPKWLFPRASHSLATLSYFSLLITPAQWLCYHSNAFAYLLVHCSSPEWMPPEDRGLILHCGSSAWKSLWHKIDAQQVSWMEEWMSEWKDWTTDLVDVEGEDWFQGKLPKKKSTYISLLT